MLEVKKRKEVKEMKAKSNKSGICPICNSEYITYNRPECADIETIYYPYVCENCKTN